MILEPGKTYMFNSPHTTAKPAKYEVLESDKPDKVFVRSLPDGIPLLYNQETDAAYWTLVKSDPVKYIIWGPSGKTNPTVVFDSLYEANKVASHMAMQHRNTFYVAKLDSKWGVKTTVVVEKQPV